MKNEKEIFKKRWKKYHDLEKEKVKIDMKKMKVKYEKDMHKIDRDLERAKDVRF